jgi:hypothetical protein
MERELRRSRGKRLLIGDQLDDDTGRHGDEELAFTGKRHLAELAGNAAESHSLDQRQPFLGPVDAQGDVVDARGSWFRRRGGVRPDQMDDRPAICIKPVALDAKWRPRTLAEADDRAKEAPCGFEVAGEDRCVVKFHDKVGVEEVRNRSRRGPASGTHRAELLQQAQVVLEVPVLGDSPACDAVDVGGDEVHRPSPVHKVGRQRESRIAFVPRCSGRRSTGVPPASSLRFAICRSNGLARCCRGWARPRSLRQAPVLRRRRR